MGSLDEIINQISKTGLEEAEEDLSEFTLSFADKGFKLNSAGDASPIIEAIKNFPELRVLVLSGNTLGVEAAEAIGKAFKLTPNLQYAHWKDLFTGRLKTEIPDACRFLGSGLQAGGCHLVELDLSDNAFGPVGVEGIQDLITSPVCFTLQQLKLNNNGLGIGGGKLLSAALIKCHRLSTEAGKPLALKVFICGRNRQENPGATALAEFFEIAGTLEEIEMIQNGIFHPGITALANSFLKNKNLRHINLNDNTLTPVGAAALAKVLPNLQKLEKINFGDCLLKSKGAKYIAAAIKNGHRRLKELNLSFNEIKVSGALAVAGAITNKEHITSVNLDGNQLGESGCSAVRDTLENLNKLDILNSMSDDEGECTDEEEDVEEEDVEVVEESFTDSPATVDEFLSAPTAEKLLKVTRNNKAAFVDAVKEKSLDTCTSVDELSRCVMLVSSVLPSTSPANLPTVLAVCDVILQEAAASSDVTVVGGDLFTNSLVVCLGLIKSEDKKFKITWSLEGPLMMLSHCAAQAWFPASTRSVLQCLLSMPNPQFDAHQTLKHQVMSALFTH